LFGNLKISSSYRTADFFFRGFFFLAFLAKAFTALSKANGRNDLKNVRNNIAIISLTGIPPFAFIPPPQHIYAAAALITRE